jgi:hypothetical protein
LDDILILKMWLYSEINLDFGQRKQQRMGTYAEEILRITHLIMREDDVGGEGGDRGLYTADRILVASRRECGILE